MASSMAAYKDTVGGALLANHLLRTFQPITRARRRARGTMMPANSPGFKLDEEEEEEEEEGGGVGGGTEKGKPGSHSQWFYTFHSVCEKR